LPAPEAAVPIVQLVSTSSKANRPNTSRAQGVSLIDRINRPVMPANYAAKAVKSSRVNTAP
jgi:hypothetical protein